MEAPTIGDYVLATKYDDGDPGDAWAIGDYAGTNVAGRHMVTDGDGEQIRASGYRKVGRVTPEYGTWLLSVAAPALEKSPPGTVNLWTMATTKAFGDDDPGRKDG